jgi:hypothetical protein
MMLKAPTWRGVVWGGWLALMMPRPEFVEVLERAEPPRLSNLWAVECALYLLAERTPPGDLAAVNALAARVRDAVSALRIERRPLRRLPDAANVAILEKERRLVRAAYRAHGAETALPILRLTRLYELTMPYPDWCAVQRRRRA